MKFQLSDSPMRIEEFCSPEAGGFVTFEGKVRNKADGRPVVALEYEAYEAMACKQGNEILEEAIKEFGLTSATAVHRIGRLAVGETAVIVQVSASHRHEAFAACEWIMDQIKWRVTIWKREIYADGPSEWVGVEAEAATKVNENRFIRQMRLPQVGEAGQSRLQSSRVLIVGGGGLTAGSLPALVGAGVGAIAIADPDTIEHSNLHRQTIFGDSDVGRRKVDRLVSYAKRLRPELNVIGFPEKITESNVDRYVAAFDWIVDGTDSLACKFLLNRACRKAGKALVTASVYQFEGQVMTVLPDGPCLQCLFPVEPPEDCVGTCAEVGVMAVVPTMLGVLQANEVIKGILGLPTLSHQLTILNLLTMEWKTMNRNSDNDCPTCSQKEGQSAIAWEIDSLDQAPTDYQLVDIREFDEVPEVPCQHVRVPMSQCYDQEWEKPTVFVCASGRRSFRLASELREQGNQNVYTLQKGVQNPCFWND